MNKGIGAFAFFLIASLGAACSGAGLKSSPAMGGASGFNASGGIVGSGGSEAGGTVAKGSGGNGGGGQNSAGSAAGGTMGTGGILGFGGRGGSNTGGTCPLVQECPFYCPYGHPPNSDPCSCECAPPPDAGSSQDVAPDAECLHPPCALPICLAGYQLTTPSCGCPTCVPVDAGVPDAPVCALVACPTIACAGGMVPNPDPCGCPICAPRDAAVETPRLACVDLDECTCQATSGCSAIVESCYCPYPQCSSSGACVCGGGKFMGCAPANLTTCTAAKARVVALCPQLAGATFDKLCQPTDNGCITKCLNEVGSCSDISCAFCEACDCATDRYMTCLGQCQNALTQK